MKNHVQWLRQEIQHWLADGIIDTGQARQLNDRYPLADSNTSWGKIIFSAIGALLIGLGVILFFAYNWDAMHRLVKLSIVLSMVVISHGIGWYLSFQRPHSQHLGESLHLLGTLLFGAGIWLIAQIYHIDEHYPNGILIWSLGAMAMAWVLNSTVHALLAMALIGFWCGAEIFDFQAELDWAPWVIGALVIPFAWHKNSPLLMFFACALFMFLLFIVSIANDLQLTLHLLFIIALGLMTAAKIVPRFNRQALENVMFGIGTLVYFALLFTFTFVEAVDDLYIDELEIVPIGSYIVLPLLLVAGIGKVLWQHRATLLPSNADLIDAILKWITVLLFTVLTFVFDSGLPAFVFNIILFAHSILYLLSGMEHLRWQRVAFGGFILALLILVRFLDLFDSLLLRSLAFIVIGVGLFVVGVLFSRQKASNLQTEELAQHG